ncbi:uncharacterized protein LOC143864473 [Tasmannia lanceolata]|uniref:uncharacterized protein LOC143864473 n=1 Tax=Tasmannia lanceolata TaxID=3420 RepID=UPI00406445FC
MVHHTVAIVHQNPSYVIFLNLTDTASVSNCKIACNFNLPVFPSANPPKFCRWIPPDSIFLKPNSDASLVKGQGSLGGLIRNHLGEVFGMFSINTDPEPIHQLELEAIFHGTQLVRHLNLLNLWLESDSSHAVNIIKGSQKCPWQKLATLARIRSNLSDLEAWKISHVWREANSAADILSKHDYFCKGEAIAPNFRSPSLVEALASDSSGSLYIRL